MSSFLAVAVAAVGVVLGGAVAAVIVFVAVVVVGAFGLRTP